MAERPHPNSIFSIRSEEDFNAKCLEVYTWQLANNPIYNEYVNLIGLKKTPKHYSEIPFLPIQFFKSKKVVSGKQSHQLHFSSSSTTGTGVSNHYVVSANVYETSFNQAFKLEFGDPSEWLILALLPSYLERSGSSLVYMAQRLIEQSKYSESGFFLNNFSDLSKTLQRAEGKKIKTLLLGVTFGLLDFAEQFPMPLNNTTIMETGGMKGRRKELTRPEVHEILQEAFACKQIASEYGMTELLSQAYSKENGIFNCPPWMRVLIRQTNDPLQLVSNSKTGGINVIDLANIDSCSFIATQDLGKLHANHQFEILGRFDNSDVRGCNLMAP